MEPLESDRRTAGWQLFSCAGRFSAVVRQNIHGPLRTGPCDLRGGAGGGNLSPFLQHKTDVALYDPTSLEAVKFMARGGVVRRLREFTVKECEKAVSLHFFLPSSSRHHLWFTIHQGCR